VGALSDALSDVITKYVRDAAKKTDALSQVELRKMLEPYKLDGVDIALQHQFEDDAAQNERCSSRSMDSMSIGMHQTRPFIFGAIAVGRQGFTAKFGASTHILICLRDNIFRALVDTKSVEYDKIESLAINLEWNSRSLFELIARRVAPHRKLESAVAELRDLLRKPLRDSGGGVYARHVLQRPRDYINFFRNVAEGMWS